MRKEVVEFGGMTYFAEISLIIFVSVFVLFLLRVFFLKKKEVKEMESLPLEDGTEKFESFQDQENTKEAHS